MVMHKFYCPKCKEHSEQIRVDNTAQSILFPSIAPNNQQIKNVPYSLHFIVCGQCDTVVATIPIKED